MRNSTKIRISIAVSLLMAISAFAADVKMSIEPQLISLLDRAVLKIEFTGTKGDAVDIPEVEGLRIQYQGQSSETRIVNFKRSSKVIHKYLVTPSKVGDFTIGPVTCKYRGGQKEVSAQLRVINPEDDKEAQQISEIMFSHLSVDRESPYVHEPFRLELKVYIRDGEQIDGNFSLRGGIPESGMEGELKWNVTGRTREDRQGTIFNVYTLKTTAKTLTSGTFSFKPQVQVNVIIPRQDRRPYGFEDPFFGDLFGRQEARAIILDCNVLDIIVKPVPTELRPESYTGGVGIFDFEVEVGPEIVKSGEPITIKMRISGQGNINQITPPKLEGNADLKLYAVRSLPSQAPNEVCFEQVLIPTSDRVVEIPALSFSYFNTQTSDFRTLTKGPFPVTVKAIAQQTAQVIATFQNTIPPKTTLLGRDIIYLKPLPKIWKKETDPQWHTLKKFYLVLTLPAIFLLTLAGIMAHRNKQANNVARTRRQKAPKSARKNIRYAEKALRKNDESAFYEALWNTLTEYFGHRLNLAPGEVSLSTVLTYLPQETKSLTALFNTLEQRRYSTPSEGHKEEMKNLLKQLNGTLRKCERIKR